MERSGNGCSSLITDTGEYLVFVLGNSVHRIVVEHTIQNCILHSNVQHNVQHSFAVGR